MEWWIGPVTLQAGNIWEMSHNISCKEATIYNYVFDQIIFFNTFVSCWIQCFCVLTESQFHNILQIGRILKKHLKEAMDQLNTWLPIMQLSLNLKILERTESKPFELFYRRPFNSFTNFANIDEYLDIATALEIRI